MTISIYIPIKDIAEEVMDKVVIELKETLEKTFQGITVQFNYY